MKLRFAKALQSQHKAIDRLMTDAFTPYVIKMGGGPRSGPYPDLAEAIDKGDVYLGLDGEEIVGAVVTIHRSDELNIDQLAVAPGRQKEGIGGWLLEQIEKIARRKQAKTLTLQTAEIMPDLVRLYKKNGFRVVRKAPPEHGDDVHLRVHMAKQL
jgi:ribosomal protein S18 acetylase RimI-like enzyme